MLYVFKNVYNQCFKIHVVLGKGSCSMHGTEEKYRQDLVENGEVKRLLGKHSNKWEDDIKRDLTDTG